MTCSTEDVGAGDFSRDGQRHKELTSTKKYFFGETITPFNLSALIYKALDHLQGCQQTSSFDRLG